MRPPSSIQLDNQFSLDVIAWSLYVKQASCPLEPYQDTHTATKQRRLPALTQQSALICLSLLQLLFMGIKKGPDPVWSWEEVVCAQAASKGRQNAESMAEKDVGNSLHFAASPCSFRRHPLSNGALLGPDVAQELPFASVGTFTRQKLGFFVLLKGHGRPTLSSSFTGRRWRVSLFSYFRERTDLGMMGTTTSICRLPISVTNKCVETD